MKTKFLIVCLCIAMTNTSFAKKPVQTSNLVNPQSSELVFTAQPLQDQTNLVPVDEQTTLNTPVKIQTLKINQTQVPLPSNTQTQKEQPKQTPKKKDKKPKEQHIATNNQETKIQDVKTEQPCLALQLGFDVSYHGDCHQGLPNGYGVAKGSLGTYKGGFVNGLFDGHGVLDAYIVADAYEGSFKSGKKDGQGYIYDRFSRENRLARFENDKFIAWLDNTKTSSSHEYDTNNTMMATTNNTSIYDKKPQVGQQTTYGKIISIDGQIVTVEKIAYDKDGYQRPEIHKYPISLFNRSN